MKKLLTILLIIFTTNAFAVDGGGPGKGTRHRTHTAQSSSGSWRTYQPKGFYTSRHAPKKHNSKSMPSKTRHIGH